MDKKTTNAKRVLSFRVAEETYQSLFQLAATRTVRRGEKCTASSVLESLIQAAAKRELKK